MTTLPSEDRFAPDDKISLEGGAASVELVNNAIWIDIILHITCVCDDLVNLFPFVA